jgi:hypothetical protein
MSLCWWPAHLIGQRGDALGIPIEAEAIAEIGEEGDAKLAAGTVDHHSWRWCDYRYGYYDVRATNRNRFKGP